ncbi:GNAT family N-acetyltransferase [Streptococcus halichoeri]|uniref:GNAT family N-acetyltransferase n=1 Tax=Streptococcus halichoeri TaxID=254785 RepID=UPI001358AC8C|nr:GNAT family protein [Streptococcus halichoeri]
MPEAIITIDEAQPQDARELLACLRQMALETDYLSEVERLMTGDARALENYLLQSLHALDQLCLILRVDGQIAGLLNLVSSDFEATSHIAELFIAIKKTYWGYGLGRELIELGLAWTQETPSVAKIELAVQSRNHRAIQLYRHCGFVFEGTRKRAIKTKDGELIDVDLMGLCL